MKRRPVNIHIFQFREGERGGWEYAILQRADDPTIWQGLSGGVRDEETDGEAARRICGYEGGCPREALLYRLDSVSSLPVTIFGAHAAEWGPDVVVVPQRCFAVEWGEDPRLSEQHLAFRWCTLEEAVGLMRWQTQQTALWELEERLRRGNLRPAGEGKWEGTVGDDKPV